MIDRTVGGGERYHDVAAVADAVLTRGGEHRGHGGDLALLNPELSYLAEDHATSVEALRTEIGPAAVDQLARFATAVVPPKAVNAYTTPVATASGRPRGEADRQALIDDLVARGTKVDPAEVLVIARAPDGRIVWIERGNEKAGLAHILRARRLRDFMSRGVAPTDVPGIAVRAVTDGVALGRVGRDGVVCDVDVGGGRREKIVAIVASNGFIVTAYPYDGRRMTPMEGPGA